MKYDLLMKLYLRHEITPHDAAVEIARLVDRENLDGIMRNVPQMLFDSLQRFVVSYVPGKMLSNYGDIPPPQNIDLILEWLRCNCTEHPPRHNESVGDG